MRAKKRQRIGWGLGAVGVCVLLMLSPLGGSSRADHAVPVLVNPAFDLPYAEQGAGELKVAHGWQGWWLDRLTEIPGVGYSSLTNRPEYKPATAAIDPYRPRGGVGTAQQWFHFSSTGYAGVLQQVAVTPGQLLQFTVWAHGWCSSVEGEVYQCPLDRMYVSLGIDPQGRTDPKSRAVIWSQWAPASGVYKQFASRQVRADGDRITVFVSVAFKWGLRHNNAYIDDAELVLVDQGQLPSPTPQPCLTPQPGAPCDYDRIRAEVLGALAEWDRR